MSNEAAEGWSVFSNDDNDNYSDSKSNIDDDNDNVDDNMYDPSLDDADANWVRSLLGGGKLYSDAALHCPACFSLLTLCSQRHTQYEAQFRAVIVHNVEIRRDIIVKPDIEDDDTHNQDRQDSNDLLVPNERYYRVECTLCRTHVGVVDVEEVFHFTHVIEAQI